MCNFSRRGSPHFYAHRLAVVAGHLCLYNHYDGWGSTFEMNGNDHIPNLHDSAWRLGDIISSLHNNSPNQFAAFRDVGYWHPNQPYYINGGHIGALNPLNIWNDQFSSIEATGYWQCGANVMCVFTAGNGNGPSGGLFTVTAGWQPLNFEFDAQISSVWNRSNMQCELAATINPLTYHYRVRPGDVRNLNPIEVFNDSARWMRCY